MIRRQQFDFRFLTTLSYVYSNGTHIIFSQTQWCMRSGATRTMNFGCMYVEHCMPSQFKDCKVPKHSWRLKDFFRIWSN